MSYDDLDLMSGVQDLDFSVEIVGPLHLYDYSSAIPDDAHLEYFETMEPITREQLFPIIIRALFCARANIWLSGFFSELILREAITLKTVEDLIDALENNPNKIHASEMQLFTKAFERYQTAHAPRSVLNTGNVTNAIVGYTTSDSEPREEVVQNWLAEVSNYSECNVDMIDELREKFNRFTLARIMGTA